MTPEEEEYVRKFTQKVRDCIGELHLRITEGKITKEEAQHELDTWKATIEMISIVIEMGAPWPDPEERMRQEPALIAKWPEACRRAGVNVPMPEVFMRGIVGWNYEQRSN
jgi:hypothetical protein